MIQALDPLGRAPVQLIEDPDRRPEGRLKIHITPAHPPVQPPALLTWRGSGAVTSPHAGLRLGQRALALVPPRNRQVRSIFKPQRRCQSLLRRRFGREPAQRLGDEPLTLSLDQGVARPAVPGGALPSLEHYVLCIAQIRRCQRILPEQPIADTERVHPAYTAQQKAIQSARLLLAVELGRSMVSRARSIQGRSTDERERGELDVG